MRVLVVDESSDLLFVGIEKEILSLEKESVDWPRGSTNILKWEQNYTYV